jgi:hypothetical protein
LLSNIVAIESVAGSDRIKAAAVTAVASFITILIALWLERICRIKEPPTETEMRNSSPA